jgi:RES domain-containing protein
LVNERRFIFELGENELSPVLGPVNPSLWVPSRLEDLAVPMNAGSNLYRCRDGWLKLEDMGAPPPEKATGGRANSKCIPVLYTATDKPTALAELRPWKGQRLSLATGVLQKEAHLADLTRIREISSPFDYEPGTDLHVVKQGFRFLERLSKELSIPVDPRTADIDYLPTQYLSELIKHCGYDGMIYPSAMGTGSGTNVALFAPTAVLFESVDQIVVDCIEYSYRTASYSDSTRPRAGRNPKY